MKRTRVFVLLLLIVFTPARAQVDTLRIATYNLLRFPYNNGTGRLPYLRTVMAALQPDVLVVQELQSVQGMVTFLQEVMKQSSGNAYQSAPFVNGPDTDNALFYRQDKVALLGARQIPTDLRDISEYVLEANSIEFNLYSVHLKAGNELSDENRRLHEATVLRNYLNTQPANANLIVAGDFNSYRSTEPALVRLAENQADNDGRVRDPLQANGNWSSNSAFADLHTQSTRTALIDSGSTGGLDDRFDLILVSASLLSPGGMDYVTGSYRAFGNDGRHYNQAIHAGVNFAVPDSVARALHYASDHLPVFAMFVVGTSGNAVTQKPLAPPAAFMLLPNSPNPFHAETQIRYHLQTRAPVTLHILDLAGRQVRALVDQEQPEGVYEQAWEGRNDEGEPVAAGVYFCRLQAAGFATVRKMILLR